MNYSLLILLIVAYLLGSLSFAIIVSKFMKMADPRSYGSNNAGATNVMRSGNKKAAALTLIGDLLKGLIVVVAARMLVNGIDGGDAIVGICGVLAVIGHIYPIFFKFKGGKGVATAIGVLLGFSPLLALLLVISWLIVFKATKVSSLAAILATLLSPVYAFILMGNSSYFGATTIIAFFVIYKHKENIVRLIKGEEHSFKAKTTEATTAEAAPTVVAYDPSHDYYQILGVDVSASNDEIKRAYAKLTNNSLPEDEAFSGLASESQAVTQLQLVYTAFAVLSDAVLRGQYDVLRKQYVSPHHDEWQNND